MLGSTAPLPDVPFSPVLAMRLAKASAARADRPDLTISRAASRCLSADRVSRGRACPISSLPSASRRCVSSPNCNRRNRLVTAGRERPTASATASWVMPNSSDRRANPRACSRGLRSSRCMFSINATHIAAWSSSSRTTAGISCRPASWAARQRRSPAMISNLSPAPRGRAMIGCNTP